MIALALAAFSLAQPAPPAAAVRAPVVQNRDDVGVQVQGLFARLDVNRDGLLTRAEAAGGRAARQARPAPRGERRVQKQDPARQQQRRMMAFDRIDANRDGVISRNEFAAAPPVRQQRRLVVLDGQRAGVGRFGGRMFDRSDVNRDGRVSLQEATAAAYQRFDMADLNRDGRLTREERQQRREQRRANPRGA